MPDRLLALVVAVPFLLGAAAAPPADDGDVVFELADPAIVESSGLVVTDDLFVTVNDSGDAGRVFAVDAAGETVGTTSWAAEPTDVEALAPAGPGEVWVGDIGDNRGARDFVEVLRVPVGRGDREVDPQRYELVHADGAADAESLLAHPVTGQLVVITKSFFGGVVEVAPRRLDADRPNRLRAVGSAPAIATDAAFFPDGRHLVVRGYRGATVLAWPSLGQVGELELPDQPQGEGIAVAADGQVYVSTEGLHSPVARVPVPAELAAALAPATPSAPATPPAPPEQSDAQDAVGEEPDLTGVQWPWIGAGVLMLLLGVLVVALVGSAALLGWRRARGRR
ncbi:hypothetical protein [Nocardioides pantholopis]|uniref:hypothetical protein n=1 Tax=Nocardioides pantholopis TaxID=2483798 RepID=UPI0013DDB6D1|nr:hypothetical protein [Nocardioides pantholopis]